MNPAAGSHAAGSPDDAASVALKGASLAFQKRSGSHTQHDQATSLAAGLRPIKRTGSRSNSSRSSSPPPLQNQQFSLEHYRDNAALLAATSSLERAKSPGAPAVAGKQQPGHARPLKAAAADAQVMPGIDSEAALPSGLVAARLQQLGVAENTTATANSTDTTTTWTVAPVSAAATARAPSASPSSHLALRLSLQSPAGFAATLAKLDAKSPSLIAATLAARRSASPTPTTSKRPRQMQSVNALREVDVVDSQPIPPTNSLISMFEHHKSAEGVHATQRQIPTSLPERSVERRSTRPLPINIKQTTVAPDPPIAKAASKKGGRKSQPYDRPPASPQALERKRESEMNWRPPTTPAAAGALRPTPETPTTKPAAASKAIAHAAASKPRVTPPKTTGARKTDSPSNTAVTSTAGSPSKASVAMKQPDVAAEADARQRPQQPSALASSKQSKDGKNTADLPPPSSTAEPTTPRQKSPTPHVISRSTPEVLSPKPTRDARAAASLRPNTPQTAIILRPTSGVKSLPFEDPKKSAMGQKRPPTPPKPRNSNRLAPTRSGNGRPRGTSDTPLSGKTPVHSMWGLPIVFATTSNTPRVMKSPPPPPTSRDSIVSAPPSPTHGPVRRRQPKQPPLSPMPLSSMASAIMASSLASARITPHNTGPSLPPPALPKRHQSPRLLQTLRQPRSKPEDDHGWKRKPHRQVLYSSKHMHHEGSRSRWRDRVTDRERKRYEALWASNRGLLLGYESPSAGVGSGLGAELSGCVVNVVVRDIWKRSRLPAEELAEVWDLVDREHRGYLTRQEFVVGMFLIDQRLRGRKLPPKVSDSIWGSAHGVTVLKPRPRH